MTANGPGENGNAKGTASAKQWHTGLSAGVALAAFLSLVTSLLMPRWVRAAEESRPEVVGIRVGLAGSYKAGLWTPVEVTLRGGSRPTAGQLALTVADGDGAPARYATPPTEPCQLPAEQESTRWMYVRFGRSRASLSVEFLPRDGAAVERVFHAGDSTAGSVFPEAIGARESLIVVVAADTMGVDRAAALHYPQGSERARLARIADLTRLPTRWFGYEGVDAVVLSTSRAEIFAGLKPDGPQIAALEEWVRMGGMLVLSAGRRAGESLGEGALLARFAPGRFQKTLVLRQSNVLETYSGSTVPIPRQGPGGRGELRVAQLADVEGSVEVRDATLPLVVRRAVGFGQVVYAAFDLDEPPLAGWQDRGLLVGKLLDLAPPGSDELHQGAAVIHQGYSDMAGQLRSALDQFPDVTLIPFWLVVVLICGYLLLVGPGDYFFLRKVVRRMEFTWISFSLIVVAFSAGAYLLAQRLKGDRIRVNQVDLVDVDARSGRLRGTSWANVLSPKVDRYDLSFAPQSAVGTISGEPAVLVSWLGLPGEGFGGMASPTTAFTPWRQSYALSPALDAVLGVPIQVWATKSFTARWTARTEVRIDARLTDLDRALAGSIASRLDFPLADCRLCYGRWVYEIGDLPPGRSVPLDSSVNRRDLKTFLTGRKLLLQENREISTPYDRASVEVGYVLRAMTFFKAAGGSRYFGLAHRYQGFVDSSDLLGTGHAILIGTVPSGPEAAPLHGARILRDGQPLETPQDRHTTVYRFVFPVKKPGS